MTMGRLGARLAERRARILSGAVLFVLLTVTAMGLFAGVIAAEGTTVQDEAGTAGSDLGDLLTYQRREQYRAYLDRYGNVARPRSEILVPAHSYTAADSSVAVYPVLDGKQDVVLTGEQGFVEWVVDVAEEGLYSIEIQYYPLPGRNSSIERAVQINGEIPFDGADTLVFHRIWGDEGPFLRDTAGNEIRPSQVEKPQWQSVYFRDSLAYESEPYLFHFSSGENRIRLISRAEPMAIASLKLCQVDSPRSYSDVSQEYNAKGYRETTNHLIKIQGEAAVLRSSPSLFPVFDQGDPTMEPYHPSEIRLNSIGGYRWQKPGDWIAWEFEVPESGLYKIAIKGKQNITGGAYSNRRILIDGQVPFAELDAVRFSHSTRYQMTQLGLDQQDAPFLVYLEKGKHELRMEAVLGSLADLLRKTEATLYELNTMYRSIIMITSATPDPLRSYELEKRIPVLIDKLKAEAANIRGMAEEFERLTGQKGGHSATLIDIALMLERMAAKPWIIPGQLAQFRDAVGNLGTWVMNTRNQPLQIDYILVASPEQTMPRATPTFFQTLVHEVRAFIESFSHDYTGIRDMGSSEGSDRNDVKPIKVWIGSGRDQAQVLKQMIEDTFTPETGIPVILELVGAMQELLVPSSIAGTAPDVALGAANMDLAFRGAVANLAQFSDFEEVTKRFKPSAITPFAFRDQVYALPETQSFPMLFYRKDILAELGLPVPNTWEDVYAMLPALHKNNLLFGIPPTMGTFEMFLYQKGVALYKEDCIEANLESEAAIATFVEMTDLYSLYGFPLEYNLQNRFRLGEMPVAIADYSLYNTLAIFAPEIRGAWGMAPIPGTVQEDGTINRSVPAGSSGAIILEASKQKEQAWEFLKWWTRADTQVRFGREMESLIGEAARYATANVEALQQLPWTVEQRQLLNAQWDWVEGIPPVLGGYYVTRHFDWLFRAVVLDNQPVRDSVIDYSREINMEIARKRAELGYETDIDKLDQKWKDIYWDRYIHVNRLDWTDDEAFDHAELLKKVGLEALFEVRKRAEEGAK